MKPKTKQLKVFSTSPALALFAKRIYTATRHIRRGRVSTYRDIAGAVGIPTRFRWVGYLMSKNHDTSIPCHRVIQSGGHLGGYNGVRGRKEKLLLKEGVEVKDDIVDLRRFGEDRAQLRSRVFIS